MFVSGPFPSQFATACAREVVLVPTPSETSKVGNPRAMQVLGALFLLLTTCLASMADDTLTLPDIQVQENFIESRVRLTSLAEMATVVVWPCH